MAGEPTSPSPALLRPEDAIALLRSPTLGPGFIRSLLAHPAFGRLERVRAAIVLHPNTPRPLAMSLVNQLRWASLQRVAAAPSLAAPLALAAERTLLLRLPELALGEKIALARIATPAVVRTLRSTPAIGVLRALLQNPRFGADDALFVATRADVPGAALQTMAESPRFQGREEVRRAIAVHPLAPPQTALRIVSRLGSSGLLQIVADAGAPPLVRIAAERLLEASFSI